MQRASCDYERAALAVLERPDPECPQYGEASGILRGTLHTCSIANHSLLYPCRELTPEAVGVTVRVLVNPTAHDIIDLLYGRRDRVLADVKATLPDPR